MYSVIQPAASATEMHVSGQSRNIKEIDLAAVFLTRQDREILALITSFDLSHNNIEQLHQLDALTALTRLNVSYNKIARIGFLPVTITELDLSHNSLPSLEGIGSLPHLRDLNVSYNCLKNLMGLSRSQPLQVLRAGGNRIVSTIGLESMAQLRLLSLDHNLIDNANELHFLSSTTCLEMLSLRENPVANMNGYRTLVARLQLSVLSLDGVPLLRAETACPSTPKEVQKLTLAPVSLDTSRTIPPPMSDAVTHATFPPATPMEGTLAGNNCLQERAARGTEVAAPSKKVRPKCYSTRGEAAPQTAAGDMPALSECGQKNHIHDHNLPKYGSLQSQRQKIPEKTNRKFSQELLLASLNVEKSGREPQTKKTTAVETSKNLAILPSHAVERKLHEAELLLEDMRKENEYLRTRNKTIGDQLKEARRVITSQLDEINRLRLQLNSAEENEKKLKGRLDKMKRGARVVDMHTHNTVDAMVIEQERLKAVYEAQIADLRQQLRCAHRQLATAVTAKITQSSGKIKEKSPPQSSRSVQGEADVNDASVEIQAVIVDDTRAAPTSGDHDDTSLVTTNGETEEQTPGRVAGLRAADIGKLAGELKNWLYSEMAEDARRAEEERVLDKIRQSLDQDSTLKKE
ncbi:Basal body protein [Trypanosoma cruzi]|uniref:Basal body protein n=1 Tax=Trypanosoma cruzi TaxID=5693 RepID=A0A7J6Y6L0_TRYCR|nr:Basal body protein [Trypanosoma cruzi]